MQISEDTCAVIANWIPNLWLQNLGRPEHDEVSLRKYPTRNLSSALLTCLSHFFSLQSLDNVYIIHIPTPGLDHA